MANKYTDAVFRIHDLHEIENDADGNPIAPFSAADKAVLMALAHYASDKEANDGECWPGLGTLAKDTYLSRRTVIRSIKKLERIGFFDVKSGVHNPERQSNTYKLDYRILCYVGNTTPEEVEAKKRNRKNGKQPDGTIRLNGKKYTSKPPQMLEEGEFLDEKKARSFNIEGDDDELA